MPYLAIRSQRRLLSANLVRYFSATTKSQQDAIVVGAYKTTDNISKTLRAAGLTDAAVSSLSRQLAASRFQGKESEVRLFYDVEGVKSPIVSVVGLGALKQDAEKEVETARNAAAAALVAIKGLIPKQHLSVTFTSLGNDRGTVEGAVLRNYAYKKNESPEAKLEFAASGDAVQYAQVAAECMQLPNPAAMLLHASLTSITLTAQNIARELMETPGNLMTPSLFCNRATELFQGTENVEVIVHDKAWAEQQNMGAFLSVAAGSEEPLRFLEIRYKGGHQDAAPLGLVGKGVTFDSGGISIKPSSGMSMMKGDMGGAATVLGAVWGIAQLKVPVNLVAVMPLTENMPSGRATKPGDVVRARNGKTIEVDNTDAEGRLILADAIDYLASTYKPHTLVELSTLTGAMDVALGDGFAGVFVSKDSLWNELHKAGLIAGDRFWRMPLDPVYKKQIKSDVADLKNVGGRSAGSCTAAIFLNEFIPKPRPEGADTEGEVADTERADIAGVMHKGDSSGYISKGMTGRPTRSIIEFARSQH
ncbi:cytosol aminopeptidase family, catalytic domain-containing protein [Gaertneriomyces semiglobifer]|nr:cytosol aminopeptidase family, catalytic domain-containing protein [Gaertneriomyces semiglobifer]